MASSASHSRDNISISNTSNNNSNVASTHLLELVPSVQCHEAANEILIQSQQPDSSHQAQVRTCLMKLHPLGLNLPITPSLVDLVHNVVNDYYSSNVGEVNRSPNKVDAFGSPEKLKAARIKINSIKIGTWERRTMHYDDLMAKCYFAKRKLVWEVMINRLKRKIEILWSDIMAIRACFNVNEQDTLEIELRERPAFYLEEEPQPRKHSIWKTSPDFTNGQASICRRHFLAFPPGALNMQYQKMLECDPRLSELSKKGFPSLLSSLYFEPTNYGPSDIPFVNLDGGIIQPMQQLQSIPSVPSPFIATQPYLHQSHLPVSDQHYINQRQAYDNPRMGCWIQGLSNYAGWPAASKQDQVTSTQCTPTAFSQMYNISRNNQEAQRVDFCTRTLRDIEKHLMDDSEHLNCEELNIASHNQGALGINVDTKSLREIENNLNGEWGMVNWDRQSPLPRIDPRNTLLDVMLEQNHEGKQNPYI